MTRTRSPKVRARRPLAALLQERDRMADKNVAVVMSGGNIERARYLQVLGGATPAA